MFLTKFEISFKLCKVERNPANITCSKSIETLEKGMIYVQNYQNNVTEQVNICWERKNRQKNGTYRDNMLNLYVI